MRANPVVQRLLAGETVENHRESGNSMVPRIRHREPVTLAPVEPSLLEKGDIVLAKVGGSLYTHKVSAVDHNKRRVQIANNQGHVNGWASYECVYGIVTHVGGVERPRAARKVRASQ
ncbi:MAG: S26 family signal peptidase [Chloroflexi bacterium]|nr:S26 family signal peptidase [Chloroflexota bacterium]